MTREQALDAATALYPAEMAGLDHPWLNGLLWRGRDASSPDTAAKALADEGRIRDGYVDTLWEAIRADVETVQRAKARRLDQAYRETASALESGKRAIAERLAAIRAETAERTATGRLSAAGRGGYRDGLWSERANDALLRGLRTEAQIAQALGIPYGAWMTHRPLGPIGESKILGVRDENGRDLFSHDLLDLTHEWHHVGRHFDEVLFLDPDDFPDVRTPADIADRHTAALFFYYTRMRQAPREANADKLTKDERNGTLLPAEQAIARHFEATVAPARDAFIRAIAADAGTETLRALAAPYAEAMSQHKRMADDTTKAALTAIGKPRAYRNERPRTVAGLRYAVGGKADEPRTPIASTPITTKEATDALKAKEDIVFVNEAEDVAATIKNRQRNKLVCSEARAKSRANGFTDDEHLNAATQAGELFETAHLVEEQEGKLEDGTDDPNVRIQRYVAPITIDRDGIPISATAYLTVKVSTSYRRPKQNQSEQTPNRIYSLELLELRDPRLQGQGPASNDVQPNARESTTTVPYPGGNVNPRRSIGTGITPEARAQMETVRKRLEGTDAWMKAPNGQPTRLPRRLWLLVRTPAFKAWFGDWENDPTNASKVVDTNGEPLVVYHGRFARFTVFDDRREGVKNSTAPYGTAWFASNRNTAAHAGAPGLDPLACFLNLRNPLVVDARGHDWDNLPEGESTDYLAQDAIDFYRDGLIVRNVVEGDGTLTDDYVVLTDKGGAANIKSATENTGAFAPANPDIRRAVGGWLEARRRAREAREDEARFAQAHAEGDRTTAEALVLKHARLAGYLHEAWRGTDDFGRVNLGLRRYGTPNHAIFLAGTPEMAGTYAANPEVREVGRGNQKGSGIYHVAIRFVNPLIVDAQGATWDTIPADAEGHVTSTRDLAFRAIQEGRDGVIIHNLQDHNPLNDHGAPRTPATVYIVTGHPQNIKSLDPFTYDGDGNLIPLAQRFDPRTPDIRRSVGGADPAATPARQKEAHGAYPDLGEEIATARFAVGAKRKAEYRALIAKARPNLPQGDVDAFMRELDTLDDTKKEKAALHWFVKGSLILPEDRDKLDMATQMAGKYHLDFQAFDSPAALINEANARAEAKKKKPALAYLDPDTVPQLSNKRDLGHGVVIYDVEDSPAGQQAMRQIMNSHLGRNANGEFWSPWCLLTCSPTTGALSESARKYWAHYSEAGRAAAFHNGRLCAFQSSDTRDRQWWDLNDKSHGANIPLTYSVRARDAWQTDAVPEEATVIMHDEIDETNGSVVHSDPDEKAIIGDRKNGHYQEWRMMRGRSVLTYDGYFKNGKANGPSMQRDYAPISWDVEQRIVPLVVEFVGEPGLLTMHAEFKDGAMTKPARAMDEQGRLWKIDEPQDSAKTWRMADIVGRMTLIGVPRINGITLRVIDRRNDRYRFDFLTGMELGRGKYHEARHISEAYPDLAELFDFPPKGEKRKVWTAPRRSIIGGAFAKPPQIRQIEGIRADSAERLNPVVPFAGNKTAIINAHARFFRDLGKAAVAAGGKAIDAFAGAGAYTIGLGVLGALPKGSVLNEWSVARYTMHKMLAKDPAAVVDAIRDLVGRLEASDAVATLRATLEAIREGRAEKRTVAQPVVDWFLDELNGKHGVDYVQAPGNSAFGDARMKENAQTAALYVVLQSMSTQSRPINFVWDDKAGQAAIDVAGKKADSGTLSMRFVSKDNTLKEDAFGTAQYTRRVREAGTIYQEAGLDVRRGDGWAIAKTANRGDVVFVDPAYLGVQAYGGGKNSKTSIDANDAETAIAKLVDLATWADANGVSLVYSNEFSDKSKGKKGGLTQEQYAEIWEEAMKRIGPDKARVGYMMRNRNTANADVIFATGQAKPALDAAIRRSVASTRRPPIEAATRAARLGVFREAQLRPEKGRGIDANRLIHVTDLPDWVTQYELPKTLMANGRILRKLAKKHAFTPTCFADLIEALQSPIAGFEEPERQNRREKNSTRELVLLLDVLAPTRQGWLGPTIAVLRSVNGYATLVTAYGEDQGTENKLVGFVNKGYARWVDKERVAKLPLLAETQFSLNSFNGPSDPNTDTVAYSAPEVKPQSRRAVGGADERLRAVNARVRTAALYYGRSPAEADIAQRAIVEVALFAEASRTGKTLKPDDVRRAYADFGIETDDRHAATIADRINEQARQERYTPRKKGNASTTPRDAILQQQERLRQAYDIHWTQAQKDAFAQGVAGAFGASRDLARDAMEVAKTKRDEAEAVLGLDPAISAATSAPTATNSRPCSPTTAPSPSTKTRPKPSSAFPSTTATPESSTMRLRGWGERRSGGLGGETLRGLTRNP